MLFFLLSCFCAFRNTKKGYHSRSFRAIKGNKRLLSDNLERQEGFISSESSIQPTSINPLQNNSTKVLIPQEDEIGLKKFSEAENFDLYRGDNLNRMRSILERKDIQIKLADELRKYLNSKRSEQLYTSQENIIIKTISGLDIHNLTIFKLYIALLIKFTNNFYNFTIESNKCSIISFKNFFVMPSDQKYDSNTLLNICLAFSKGMKNILWKLPTEEDISIVIKSLFNHQNFDSQSWFVDEVSAIYSELGVAIDEVIRNFIEELNK